MRCASSKINPLQDLARFLIEGLRDRQQAFDAGQVRPALDGADLRHAQLGLRRQILEGPVAREE